MHLKSDWGVKGYKGRPGYDSLDKESFGVELWELMKCAFIFYPRFTSDVERQLYPCLDLMLCFVLEDERIVSEMAQSGLSRRCF